MSKTIQTERPKNPRDIEAGKLYHLLYKPSNSKKPWREILKLEYKDYFNYYFTSQDKGYNIIIPSQGLTIDDKIIIMPQNASIHFPDINYLSNFSPKKSILNACK